MHLTLDSLLLNQDPKVWKRDPDGMESDIPEDNLEGKADEALDQITGTPSKVDAAEKGEPKTFIVAQRWFYELQVIEQLKRDKDLLLQPLLPTQIALARYGLGDTSKGVFGSGLSMPKEGSDGMEDGTERVHARHEVWCEEHQSKSINNRELLNLVEVAEEELEAGRMDEVELLFLTDNSAVEAVYYRGNSSDKEIFEFMLRLVYLELRGCFRLHNIWVAGKRQILAVIDGF